MKGNSETRGYFKSFDGTKLFYSLEGNVSKKPPILFLYGLVCSKTHWKHQIEYFKKERQVIWFDYRGNHNSQVPEDKTSITIDSCAKDALALLAELGIKSAFIVSHSMGSNVAIEMYRQSRNSIEGLVLSNATPKDPLETLFHTNFFSSFFDVIKKQFYNFPEPLSSLWRHQDKVPFWSNVVARFGFDKKRITKKERKEFIKSVARCDPAIFMLYLDDFSKNNQTPWLEEISVPTLIIAGEHDHIIPHENQRTLSKLIPNSELFIVQNGSHCPQLDMPDLINMKIDIFLKERFEKNPA